MPPPPYTAGHPSAGVASVVVTGPNHVLHAVLTLLTFWACGGWAWIWLIVAIGTSTATAASAQPLGMSGEPLATEAKQCYSLND